MPPTVPVFRSVKLTKPSPSGPFREQLVDAIDHVDLGNPAADAGKLVVLNAAGQIDTSMGGGGGGSININGSSVSSPNFNNTLPAAPGGGLNILWQASGSDVSAYIPANTYDPFGAAASKLPLAGGTLTGDLLFSLDDTHDVGASSATRPRTIYVGTSVLAPLFNAATGFQIAGAAASGHYLRGNGTDYVDSTIQAGDVPSLAYLPLAGGTLTGDLLFSTDNAHDIGASGATRPRHVYVGTDITVPVLNITGASSGVVTIQGAAAAGTWSLTLPTSAGSTGNLLSTDGFGVTSWVSPGSGTLPNRTTGTASGGAYTVVDAFTNTGLNSVPAGQVVKGSIALAKTFLLEKVVCTFPTRVRLYSTQKSRDADAGATNGTGIDRPFTLTPPPGQNHGVICDLYLDGVIGVGATAPAAVATITNVSLTSNTVTVTTANSHGLSSGQSVFVNKLQVATFLNQATLVVLPGGLTGTQFTATYNYADYSSAADAGIVYQANYLGWILSPAAEGENNDSPVASTIYYAITNLDTTTRSLSVVFTYLQEES